MTVKEYTIQDVASHAVKEDLWIIIHNKVYDVTGYLEDHPGGGATLIEAGGTDATSTFEDLGHSEDAREIMEQYVIGELPSNERTEPTTRYQPKIEHTTPDPPPTSQTWDWTTLQGLILKLVLGGVAAYICGYLVWRSPRIDRLYESHGGFWNGFGTSTATSLSILTALTVYLSKALSIHNDFQQFPAHIKPQIQVFKPVKPIGIATGTLNPREYQKFCLIKKGQMSANSYRFVFTLPNPQAVLGLPIGQHVSIRADIGGKSVSRSYTPVTNNSDLGRLELLVKVYPDGLISNYLAGLKINDEVEFRGPKGSMKYHKNLCKCIGMIAGGTGITPMYQLIRAICEDSSDGTNISLLYANRTVDDILLHAELERFTKEYPEKFKIWYLLDQPPEGWQYGKGYVTKDLILERLPSPSPASKVMLCGPPGMINAVKKTLVDVGYAPPNAISKPADQVFLF
ncbi:MAG: hypothetical protein M1827_001561 [Pycnora praestabilis]|nr:MAG: hypothetical protein M1827_001561 [Pycnora praestabilis]